MDAVEEKAGKVPSAGNVCGVLSVLCCTPYVFLAVVPSGAGFPDFAFPIVIWTIFLSPFAGILLGLIALRASRWWLVTVVLWIAVAVYGWWDLKRHPFVI